LAGLLQRRGGSNGRTDIHRMTLPSDPILILAGGEGTRTRKFSQGRPKWLIETRGQTFAALQLASLRDFGFHKITVLIHHGASEILKFLEGLEASLPIEALVEDGHALGTGGAVLNWARENGQVDHVFVTYGDTLMPPAFLEVLPSFFQTAQSFVVSVFPSCELHEPPNCSIVGDKILAYGHGATSAEWTDIGFYRLDLRWLEGFVEAHRELLVRPGAPLFFDLSDVLRIAAPLGLIGAVRSPAANQEIGSELGFARFRSAFN